jgi:putative ATP-binding cassette transporter
VSFPAPEGTFSDEEIRQVLRQLGLGQLEGRIGESEQWEQALSPHEGQRLAMARVFLNQPEWIFLDKAMAALDEATEKRIYELLAERLPHATVISVADRPDLTHYHNRHWKLVPREDGRIALLTA